MPLLKAKLTLNNMASDEVLKVIATDEGSVRDIPAYVGLSSHSMVASELEVSPYVFLIKRA
ncbi:MAG: sulfurtransferase TusA family protein [Pontibacterium sp.]